MSGFLRNISCSPRLLADSPATAIVAWISLGSALILAGYLSARPSVQLVGFLLWLIGVLLVAVQGRRLPVAMTFGILAFIAMRSSLAEFPFVVGDAAAYTLDGIRLVERGIDAGFFPPFSAAVSSLGYFAFGIDGIVWPHVVAAFLSAWLVYLIVFRMLLDNRLAIVAALLFAISPLSIWFSKTTFSETSWVLLWMLAVAVLILRDVSVYARVALFALVLALMNFSRGSAPFVALPLLAVAMSLPNQSSRERILIWTSTALLFLAGLALMMEIRAPYLIGWQYSRVKADVTPGDVAILFAAAFAIAPGAWFIVQRSLGRVKSTPLLVAALLGFKFLCLFVLPDGGAWYGLRAEATGAIHNFQWPGAVLVAVGLVALTKRAAGGDVVALALIAVYCGASAPFSLQSASADRIHDVPLYWSRYYLSEIFVVHLVALIAALRPLAFLVRRLLPNVPRIAIYAAAGLVTVDYTALAYVTRTAYLDGSNDIYSFILDNSVDRSLRIYGVPDKLYSGYGALKMLEQLPSMRHATLHRYSEAVDGATGDRVLCINLPECDVDGRLEKVSEISRVIRWDIQIGSYTEFHPRQMTWRVVAFDVK